MLKIESLHVKFGTTHAVRGISFEVPSRGSIALIGPNGAGKTSTLRAISGLVGYEGRITFDDFDLARLSVDDIARRGLIHVPEGRHVFPDLTVHENLQLGTTASNGRADGYSFDEVYDLFPGIAVMRERLGYALSGGEQQMVALGRALVGAPRLLMVDEPSLGLAPRVARDVADALSIISKRTPLLIVEQNSQVALQICEQILVMTIGAIEFRAASSELSERSTLLAAMLGQSTSGAAIVNEG